MARCCSKYKALLFWDVLRNDALMLVNVLGDYLSHRRRLRPRYGCSHGKSHSCTVPSCFLSPDTAARRRKSCPSPSRIPPPRWPSVHSWQNPHDYQLNFKTHLSWVENKWNRKGFVQLYGARRKNNILFLHILRFVAYPLDPSILQTTAASIMSNWSSHTVPHTPSFWISTRPWPATPAGPTNRMESMAAVIMTSQYHNSIALTSNVVRIRMKSKK